MKAFIFLAEGFEETEAITPIDLLRRAGVEVRVVSIMPTRTVTSSHGVPVIADALFTEESYDNADLLILPGGMPGTLNLNAYDPLKQLIVRHNEKGKLLGAICAAPLVYGKLGLLDGRNAVCYPGFEKHLLGAKVGNSSVVKDGNIITSRGAGCAVEFGIQLIAALLGENKSKEIANSIVY